MATLALSLISTSAMSAPVETVLYSFQGQADGGNPYAGLTAYDGALYGTTSSFGDNGQNRAPGLGTVFKLAPPNATPAAWTETVLHAFAGSDGANPAEGSLIVHEEALYGTTEFGGTGNCSTFGFVGCGAVFKVTLNPLAESVLFSFPGPAFPIVKLIEHDGALIGATEFSGTNQFPTAGVIFRLTPPADATTPWNETVLLSFNNVSGNMIALDGALYGTNGNGGTTNNGTVFKLTPPAGGQTAWTQTIISRIRRMTQ